MAVMDAILTPGEPRGTQTAGLGASASTAELLLGPQQIFVISGRGASGASASLHIRFGRTGMAAAAATDFFVPACAMPTFDTGSEFTHVRVFNPNAGAIDVHILKLSKF